MAMGSDSGLKINSDGLLTPKKLMIFDSDDFGVNHVISEMCQTHDCRDMLMTYKEANPKFKATLFTVPGEVTAELTSWCQLNKDWIEVAVHGFFHTSNYECEKLSYDDFDFLMRQFDDILKACFVKGFKAPGWQISDDIYKWLLDHGYWVADQEYNNDRRPKELPVYLIGDDSYHTHTWNCVGNGIYELYEDIMKKIKDVDEFKFVSEAI